MINRIKKSGVVHVRQPHFLLPSTQKQISVLPSLVQPAMVFRELRPQGVNIAFCHSDLFQILLRAGRKVRVFQGNNPKSPAQIGADVAVRDRLVLFGIGPDPIKKYNMSAYSLPSLHRHRRP